jgi:hypothetical protein
VAERTEIECVVERIQKYGLSMCADYDEDCFKVLYPEACWLHEEGTGTCPFLCVRQ